MTSHRHLDAWSARVGPLDRRTVLRGGLGLGAATLGGVLLGACGDEAADTRVATAHTPDNALIAAFPQGVPHAASGVPTRLPYLVSDAEGVPLQKIDGPVTFTVKRDGTPVGEAVRVTPRADGVPRAYLPFTFEFPQPGVYDVFAEYHGAALDSSIQIYDASQIGPPVVVEGPTTIGAAIPTGSYLSATA